MPREEDDEAWKAIVENYGDRPAIDPTPQPEPEPPEPFAAYLEGPAEEPAEAFVPPEPLPVPRPSRDRLLAWLGVFGAPAVLLVCLVLGIDLPRLLSYALVVGFVGGFLYLVWRMPGGPRDPWDDGAQV
ncbi:hypothetical protein [Nocardioides pantholopis]|uniref:hypothetical protein n=1 Tax=Nocardioides pantholopis TaxID=2483798 RepID=UPI000F08B0BB|nr:hypothetical protein [Nocardioides pantholopis]